MFSLATLLRAGIQLDFILKDMLDNENLSPWLRERIIKIKQYYVREGNFGNVLLHLDMKFPDAELIEELAIYAPLPKFEENFYNLAKQWLTDGTAKIQKQAQLINGIIMCGIIGIVCMLGLAISSMQGNINQSMSVM
jgi:type II secretory pathway component PulF